MQINNRKLSFLRQSLERISGEIDRLLPIFCQRRLVTKGVLYQLKRRCGKPNCYCARGQGLHKSWVLSRSIRGRAQLKTVSIEEVLDLRKRTVEYRRLRASRAKLRKCFQKMLEAIDAIEQLRQTDKRE